MICFRETGSYVLLFPPGGRGRSHLLHDACLCGCPALRLYVMFVVPTDKYYLGKCYLFPFFRLRFIQIFFRSELCDPTDEI